MDAFSVSLSGLNAASVQLATTAGNLANLDTPDYRARRVDLAALSDNTGVRVAGITQAPEPGVDLAREVTGLIRAETLYTANAIAIRVTSQTTGTLLDLLDRDRDRSS
jgi:flagellar hook protein FlgE